MREANWLAKLIDQPGDLFAANLSAFNHYRLF